MTADTRWAEALARKILRARLPPETSTSRSWEWDVAERAFEPSRQGQGLGPARASSRANRVRGRGIDSRRPCRCEGAAQAPRRAGARRDRRCSPRYTAEEDRAHPRTILEERGRRLDRDAHLQGARSRGERDRATREGEASAPRAHPEDGRPAPPRLCESIQLGRWRLRPRRRRPTSEVRARHRAPGVLAGEAVRSRSGARRTHRTIPRRSVCWRTSRIGSQEATTRMRGSPSILERRGSSRTPTTRSRRRAPSRRMSSRRPPEPASRPSRRNGGAEYRERRRPPNWGSRWRREPGRHTDAMLRPC